MTTFLVSTVAQARVTQCSQLEALGHSGLSSCEGDYQSDHPHQLTLGTVQMYSISILELDWKFIVQNSSLEARLFKRMIYNVVQENVSLQIKSSFPTNSENQLTLCSTRCVPGFLVWSNVHSGTLAGNAEKKRGNHGISRFLKNKQGSKTSWTSKLQCSYSQY